MRIVELPRIKTPVDGTISNYPEGIDYPPVAIVRAVKVDLQSFRSPLGESETYEANVPGFGRVTLTGWGPSMHYRFTPADEYRQRRGLPPVIEGVGMPGVVW